MDFNWDSLWQNIEKNAPQLGLTALGGILGYKGATGAANTQSASIQNAMRLLQQYYGNSLGMLSPYQQSGSTALSALMQGMGLAPFTQTGGAPGGASPFSSPLLGGIGPASTTGSTAGSLGGVLSLAGTGAGLGAKFGGPIGAGIGAGAGAIAGTLSSLLGQGRKRENATTAVQNQVAGEVDRITKAVNDAQQKGTLTKENLQQAVDTVKGLQQQFGTAVASTGSAGKAGVATLAKYFDPLTASWEAQLGGKGAQGGGSQWNFAAGPAAGGAAPGASPISMGYFTQTPDANALLSQDPGYQARLAQGQQELDRFFASRGLATSGGAAKSAGNYGQTFASNEYGNAYNRYQQQKADTFNRLMAITGLGANATGTAVGATEKLGAGLSDLTTSQGAVNARGQVNSLSSIIDALNQGSNILGQQRTLNQVGAQTAEQQNKFDPFATPTFPMPPSAGQYRTPSAFDPNDPRNMGLDPATAAAVAAAQDRSGVIIN